MRKTRGTGTVVTVEVAGSHRNAEVDRFQISFRIVLWVAGG